MLLTEAPLFPATPTVVLANRTKQNVKLFGSALFRAWVEVSLTAKWYGLVWGISWLGLAILSGSHPKKVIWKPTVLTRVLLCLQPISVASSFWHSPQAHQAEPRKWAFWVLASRTTDASDWSAQSATSLPARGEPSWRVRPTYLLTKSAHPESSRG